MSDPIPEGNPIKGIGKKVGPLPLYAYALIVVGGAYGVYWWKNRVGVAAPVGVTDVGSGMSSAGPMPGTGTYTGTVGSGGNATPAAQSNAQWAKKVADGMIATGTPPADANNAVAAYLAGQVLTPVQKAIITIALQVYGNPPEGVVTVKGGSYVSYMLDSIMGRIYGIGADGSRTWLTGEQYAAAGKPATTSTVDYDFVKYIQGGGKIYGVTGTGNRIWLDAAQYAALGSPAVTENFDGDNTSADPWNVAGSKYVVKEGDTLGSISMAHYGSSDTGRISAANPGVILTPGTVITIP